MTDLRDHPTATLTDQQRHLLTMVAAGLTDQSIARRLGLHYGSVRRHMTVIIRVLGARNRTHAVAVAMRAGALR